MAENLEKLIEKYNAVYAFHNAGESVKSSGERDIDNDSVKQAVVVLKQSVDTAEIEDLDKVSFYAGNEKMTFIFSGEDVFGLLTPADVKDIAVEDRGKKEKPAAKGKVKLKERKKIAVKSPKMEETKEEKGKEDKEEKKESKKSAFNYKLDASIIDTVKDIAGEYLEDFAEDIVNNMMKETKIKPNDLSNEKIAEFLKKLSKSSSLIIGPTHANEMIDKINKKITE